jgi:hypothetical protein
MSNSRSPSPGRHAASAVSGPGLYVRSLQTGCTAVVALPSCTVPGGCSPAVTAIGLPMQASMNRPIDVAEERSTIGLMGFVERLGRRTSRRA